MKTILLISCLIVSGTIIATGQNYLGLSQSKIIKKYGDPDIKGLNFFVYFDQAEEGTNTYFFDSTNKCNEFVISRSTNYLEDYKKLLRRTFIITTENNYVTINRDTNFKAELTNLPDQFQIHITYLKEDPDFTENFVSN
jgi:hypothetical protein